MYIFFVDLFYNPKHTLYTADDALPALLALLDSPEKKIRKEESPYQEEEDY
jgi:hypothetical protein